jgi:hypothetical protein
MGADPDPSYRVRGQSAECTVVVADPDREAVRASLQSPKVQGRMTWIALPQVVVLDSQPWDAKRESAEQV